MSTDTLKNSGLEFEDIDIDSNPDAIGDLPIKRIPYIQFFDDGGNLLHTHVGVLTNSDLHHIVEQYG
jgi:hypothetical protein